MRYFHGLLWTDEWVRKGECQVDQELCRNMLIYFNKELQDKVLRLLRDGLAPCGFLVLGDKETLNFSDFQDDFDVVDAQHKIFRKKLLI